MDTNKLIQKIPFYSQLSISEKQILLSGFTIRTYIKSEYILDFADACLGMIYVVKGSIRVYITSEEGREITLFHITKGNSCIFSASCAIPYISLNVQLVAAEDTEILVIHSMTLKNIMNTNIYVKCFVYELSSQKLSNVIFVMQEMLFSKFDKRLARLLISTFEKTDSYQIKMTQETMAQEVNSAREVVARMLKIFSNEGYIEMNRGKVILKDITAYFKSIDYRS